MALSYSMHPLPQDLEQAALGAFLRRLRLPASNATVLRSSDSFVDGERGATLVFSAQFNQVRRFAVLVIPPFLPLKAVEAAGSTAASILTCRLRREQLRAALTEN